MQNRLLPLKLWLFICYSLLSAAKKKEQSRLGENIKDPALRTNSCWAHLSIKLLAAQLTEA